MPLDTLGRTRTTMSLSTSSAFKLSSPVTNGWENFSNNDITGIDAWKGIFNEEFLVIASHHLALITSLSFVHTARRSYRLEEKVSCTEFFRGQSASNLFFCRKEKS